MSVILLIKVRHTILVIYSNKTKNKEGVVLHQEVVVVIELEVGDR
jgi:hypothetical protein